jgi:hypothetical protein
MMCLFEDQLQAEPSCRIAWRPPVSLHTEIDLKRDERQQARANKNGRLSAGRPPAGYRLIERRAVSPPSLLDLLLRRTAPRTHTFVQTT